MLDPKPYTVKSLISALLSSLKVNKRDNPNGDYAIKLGYSFLSKQINMQTGKYYDNWYLTKAYTWPVLHNWAPILPAVNIAMRKIGI